MGNSLRLYDTIMTFLFKSGGRLHDIRIFSTFAWAVVGVLLSHTVSLTRWCQHRPGSVQAENKVPQFVRWLHNPKLDVQACFRPLITATLQAWEGEKLVLALDTSQLWGRFVIVRLSLIYRGRALPLVWQVREGGSATVAFAAYAPFLKPVSTWLPVGVPVLFLADRAFMDYHLLRLLRDLGWHFRLRLKQSCLVYRAEHRKTNVRRLTPPQGEVRLVHKVWLTAKGFGTLYLALGHVQTQQGYEKWAFVSDEPTSLQTFDEYGLRFDIEENFLDDKSGGFQLESSLIHEAEALTRLSLILAMAALYLVSTGVSVVTLGLRRVVDAHWHRGLSYFQLGWRWLDHALAQARFLLRFPWLDPEPNPAPASASASKTQDARPRVMVYAISLLT